MKNLIFVVVFTCFGIMFATAQGLPTYGVVRLQTAPAYPYGSFSLQAIELGGHLYLTGVAQADADEAFVYTFIDVYDSLSLQQLYADTSALANFAGLSKNSITEIAGGFSFPTISTSAILNSAGDYQTSITLRQLDTTNGQLELRLQDEFFKVGDRSLLFDTAFAQAVTQVGVHLQDTVAFLYSSPDSSNLPIELPMSQLLRLYVQDRDGQLLLVDSTLLEPDVPVFSDRVYELASFIRGDTLGRVVTNLGAVPTSPIELHFYNRFSGEWLGYIPLSTRFALHLASEVIPQHASFVVSSVEFEIQQAEEGIANLLKAYACENGLQVWESVQHSSTGWQAQRKNVVLEHDPVANILLSAFTEQAGSMNNVDPATSRIKLQALDANSGDPLWDRILDLTAYDDVLTGLEPMDIVVRPNREGYIVVAKVGAIEVNTSAALGSAYTALFFLDADGCADPACLQGSSVRDRPELVSLSLTPNPVRSGGILEIASSIFESTPTHYEITDMQGRLLQKGVLEMGAQVHQLSTAGLAPGSYQVVLFGPQGQVVMGVASFIVFI